MEKYISLRLVLMPRSQLPEHVASILVSTKMMHLFLLACYPPLLHVTAVQCFQVVLFYLEA